LNQGGGEKDYGHFTEDARRRFAGRTDEKKRGYRRKPWNVPCPERGKEK
jgi:hypothetical protein